MAQLVYNPAKLKIMTEGLFPTGTETYGLLLLDAALGYSPVATHEFVADVAAYEMTTTGYARQLLGGVSVGLVGSHAGLHADMVTFADIGSSPFPTAQSGVVYRQVTDASDSWLLAYLDTITAVTNGDDLIVSWDTDGIVYI